MHTCCLNPGMKLDRACYEVALICGETLTGVCIRHATLVGYIKQALALHTDRGLPNPKQVDLDYIKIMTNALKNTKMYQNARK